MRLATAFSFIVSAAFVAAQAITLNTPSGVMECYNTLLTWTGGTGPYQIQVLPGGQPSAAPLEDLGIHTGTSFTWLCKQAAGTSIFLRLKDTSSGQLSETATFTVLPGDPTRCAAAASSSASASGSSSVAAPSAPAATTPAATTPVTATPAAPSSSAAANNNNASSKAQSSSKASSSAPSASNSPGSAGHLKAPVALAGAAAFAMAVFA